MSTSGYLKFKGKQLSPTTDRQGNLRGRIGWRLVEIAHGAVEMRFWLPESEMEILAHDEQTDELEFRLSKSEAAKQGIGHLGV